MTTRITDSDAANGAPGAPDRAAEEHAGEGPGLPRRVVSSAGAAAGTAAGIVAGTAGVVRDQLPQAVEVGSRIVDTTGQVATRAAERLQTEPEDRLVAGSTFLFGVALGLFIAGAPRVMVGLALAPAVAMGLAFAERRPAAVSGRSATR